MSNILTQEEVDALLRGISGGEIETEAADRRDPSEIEVYDLTSEDRIIRGRMPTLEMTNDKFARTFRSTLSSTLRKVINVSTLSTDMVKFGDFMKTLPVPTSLHLFKMDPLRGNAIFVVEAKIIFTLVDIIFGGAGTTVYKIEGREFTAIENNLIKKIVQEALADMEKSWRPLIELNIAYQRSEINPQFVQIVPPTDVVVVVNFELEIEYTTGIISLCIPYATLEPIREKLQAGYQSEQMEVDRAWAKRFKDALLKSGVDIAVELGHTQIHAKDLLHLQKGDVIRLDQYAADALNVYVEDITKYRANPCLFRGNKAVQISKLITAEEGDDHGTE